MGKHVPESKFTEWKGLDRIQTIVHEMKCIWREISKDDFGIDGEIEVVVRKVDGSGFETLGNIIKVQAKSGASYVVQDTPSSFTTPVKKEDMDMWANANYPVLFVVYHPAEDKLYCKEIRRYVRSAVNAFQPPFRVVFEKKTDEFNAGCFDSVRRHAEVSQPRVSFQQKEQLFSNLLSVRRLPSMTHASTTCRTGEDIRAKLQGGWPPFCIVDGRLYTFGDLREGSCILRGFCGNDIQSLTIDEWINVNADRQADYVYLLNQLLGKLRWQLRLKYNRRFGRTYFPREDGMSPEFRRTWFNVRSHQKAPDRLVAKYYEYGAYKFWRHLACHLSFVNVGHAWFLRIIPKYFFTTDGMTPWDSELVGPYTTTLKAMEHNLQVLNHVLFWADTLAQGKEFIYYHMDDQMILKIDRTPMTGIAGFAIVDDPATLEEKVPPRQFALFDKTLGEEDD